MEVVSVVEKIQKLLALQEGATTEAEAAACGWKIAQLCEKHNLELGSIKLREEETEATVKKQTTFGRATGTGAWIADAVVTLFGIGTYSQAGRTEGGKLTSTRYFYGLKASVSGATVCYLYLMASVESLAKDWKGGDLRSWKIGCATRINQRAKELQAQKDLTLGASRDESQAIVLVANALMERHKEKVGLRIGHMKGARNGSAYQAGLAAGNRVDLAQGRGRLLE